MDRGKILNDWVKDLQDNIKGLGDIIKDRDTKSTETKKNKDNDKDNR